MEPYFFHGIILPERAQLSLQVDLSFTHITSEICADAKVSIVNNQLAVWIKSEHDWDLLTLRNIVKTMVQNELAKISYLRGYAYDLEVTRVLNQSRNIDYVFGVEVPCIEERGKSINLDDALMQLRKKCDGPNGVLLHRCFNDLTSSMKHADDTAFYCYRAIETLCHHCADLHGISAANDSKKWEAFREVAGCSREAIMLIKEAADPLRHGRAASNMTSEERSKIFKNTWDVVDGYLKSI